MTHLTLGSDAYVSVDRCIGPQVDGLLDADISEGVFSKDRTGIKVGSHEAAEPGQSLGLREDRRGVEICVRQRSERPDPKRYNNVSWSGSGRKRLLSACKLSHPPSLESDTSCWWT